MEALDGNLCRCTGYRPIVTAATSFGSDFVDPRKTTKGACCTGVRQTFPDIEELGVVATPAYSHGEWAKPVVLPAKALPLAVTGRENSWVDAVALADLYTRTTRSKTRCLATLCLLLFDDAFHTQLSLRPRHRTRSSLGR